MVNSKMVEMMVWSGVIRRPEDDPLWNRRITMNARPVEEEEGSEHPSVPVQPQECECPLYC